MVVGLVIAGVIRTTTGGKLDCNTVQFDSWDSEDN